MLRSFLVLLLVLPLLAEPTPVRIAFWNIENLFDTIDDPLKRDDDFTPNGRYEWTPERLNEKYQHLAQVINDSENRPAILGLCEIENREVLETLVTEYLDGRYAIVHRDSPDERGIDVALLHDRDFTVSYQQWHTIPLPGNDRTREILEVHLKPKDQQRTTLVVFINHWPSRYGGQLESEPKRRLAASTLRQRVDQLLKSDPRSDIIIMGDFNDYPTDPSLKSVLQAVPLPERPTDPTFPGKLFNTTWDLHAAEGQGTYMYRGTWGVLDQIIITAGLLDQRGFWWESGSTSPYRKDYILQQQGKYAGWPWRMYAGGRYLGGYSDHLMIRCTLYYE